MTENPFHEIAYHNEHRAWDEGYAAGDMNGFDRAVKAMIRYIAANPLSTIPSFYDHFEELIDNEP